MAATINLPSGMSAFNPQADRLSSAKKISDLFIPYESRKTSQRVCLLGQRRLQIAAAMGTGILSSLRFRQMALQSPEDAVRLTRVSANSQRKTKIVCTIGPSTSSRDMIWKLAETGMNVARLNMSHGDHASHQKTIDLVKEYNAQFEEKVVAIMLDTKGPEVRSGDVAQPILLKEGQEFNFTIERESVQLILLVCGNAYISRVNFMLLSKTQSTEKNGCASLTGGMMSLAVKSKTKNVVKCTVVDGGELKSRRHLNVRGKSATLPSITDWEDIKFGVDNQVDFYAVSFVKDAKVVHELKDYLKRCNADIHVIPKIESADSIPNLHSILSASDGAMVARGDLGAELPIEEVPLLQWFSEVRNGYGSASSTATNMLESMIDHPTPTRAEVSDIAIAVREGADAIMLSGETAHGKFPLKAVKVMHTVALRTESSLPITISSPGQSAAYKDYSETIFYRVTIQSFSYVYFLFLVILVKDFLMFLDFNLTPILASTRDFHMGDMFALHATTMANTLATPIIVFTRTGLSMNFGWNDTILQIIEKKTVIAVEKLEGGNEEECSVQRNKEERVTCNGNCILGDSAPVVDKILFLVQLNCKIHTLSLNTYSNFNDVIKSRGVSIRALLFDKERVKQRLILYHGVMPIHMEFTDDVEKTFHKL
ncbi:hypothetical protein DH2020_020291 [Rehmannia glutinosa]|uniref:Pyruvate kinase n=1 Tax=Rehmannia glutinosa TaxID=99300 RepID=A0ABR0WG94_REHGL